LTLAAAFLAVPKAGAETVQLDSLPLIQMTAGSGSPQVGRSNQGNPLTLDGKVYQHGVGTHAPSEFRISLHRQAKRFEAVVGLDDEKKGAGSIRFEIRVDGKRVLQTPILHGGDPSQPISVDLTGAKAMTLVVTDAGDGIDSDHADWADARFELVDNATQRPEPQALPLEPLTKLAFGDGPVPAIHGPRVTGATPGRPFLFLIPATGTGPLKFRAKGLPGGLKLDSKTGIISGSLAKAGITNVALNVKGPKGVATRRLTIIGGKHKIAQTPPMGWNSWNVWAVKIDDAKVRAAADAMVSSGLAAHGFQYINIDDCWEAGRDPQGNILSNSKFPDMKALADYVHSKGLKLGIYSSPGPTTCGGYTASYQHEQQDANTYAQWGIDYLKYDWCSYGSIAPPNPSLVEMQKPYAVMHTALDNCGRDIVFSLCQYGGGDVWKWGEAIGGNCWRTTGDIGDTWGSLSGIAFSQDGHEKYAGPGHWNDPDMLIVGKVGWGYGLRDTRLNPNEQILHMSMWSLLSAPLLIGCDMSQFDKFTISLLTNDEVLAVDQDALGKPAGRKAKYGDAEVWARPLSDGTVAVGLFNRGPDKMRVTARWSDLGLKGVQPVRNLWIRKNVGTAKGAYTATVPAHGCVLVKIGKPE
jgi:alpha-galactosidase